MFTTHVLSTYVRLLVVVGTFEINQKTKLYNSRCLKLPKSLRNAKKI